MTARNHLLLPANTASILCRSPAPIGGSRVLPNGITVPIEIASSLNDLTILTLELVVSEQGESLLTVGTDDQRTSTTTRRVVGRSRNSQRYTPCQVPSASRPSMTGIDTAVPVRIALR